MKFTIERAFAVSLAIHAAILLPFVIETRAEAPDDDETLVVDLKGVTADDQSEARVTERTAGSTASQAASAQHTKAAQTEEKIDERPTEEAGPPTASAPQQTSPAKTTSDSPGSVDVHGSEQQQEAHRIRPQAEKPVDPLQAYAKALTKRVQTKLIYPEVGRKAGLQGAPTVAFTILDDGALRPDSLKVVASSGQPKLDESALKTIRACAPFEPPPREITLKITVRYGR